MNASNPQDTDEPTTRTKAEKREAELFESFGSFSSDWGEATKKEAFINRRLLLEATYRYFVDINAKKDEHGIARADSHKRAAFTVKWLLHFKPIQYHSSHTAKDAILANEQFALFIACAFLRVNLSDLSRSLVDHVLYHFRHEFYHPEPWATTFYLIESCAVAGVVPQIAKHKS